ncbi:hypothetical protein BS47DRAFT_1399047 [Hydnum rufescens UP504]|uniref:Uncharacterized protein n=1 Tax=Hydnum rufescens UP504 TaxID=1448309 RepID=A0A9P6DQ28_9AGAM|nr:hypothetical protein BS47DRAFT_1399047 [Hydnum rufescens UP504]
MSIRLLERWLVGHNIYHNPNDDLESGAWVALIGGLEKAVANDDGNMSVTEKDRLCRLNSPAVDSDLGQKQGILVWANRPRLEPHAFYGLIARWLQILDNIAIADEFGILHAVSGERYRHSYQTFVHEGLTWLEAHEKVLSMNWGDCFRSQKTPKHW